MMYNHFKSFTLVQYCLWYTNRENIYEGVFYLDKKITQFIYMFQEVLKRYFFVFNENNCSGRPHGARVVYQIEKYLRYINTIGANH